MSAHPTSVTVIAPGPWLATNDRHHWTVRAARTKVWRHAAATYARLDKTWPANDPIKPTQKERVTDERHSCWRLSGLSTVPRGQA